MFGFYLKKGVGYPQSWHSYALVESIINYFHYRPLHIEGFFKAFCSKFVPTAWVGVLVNKFVHLKQNDPIKTRYVS